jgi:hypothetical protein
MADKRIGLAIVVRHTDVDFSPFDRIELMSAFDDLDEAEAEATRLNGVRRDDDIEYFVKIVRLGGRSRSSLERPGEFDHEPPSDV